MRSDIFQKLFQRKGLKAAAIQCEAVHEDISAGLFHALHQNGVKTTAFYNEKIVQSRGDYFAQVPVPDLTVNYEPLEGKPAWDAMARKIRQSKPDFLVVNTFQRDGVAKWLTDFNLPILGIVHNPDILKSSPFAMALIQAGKVHALALALHVKTKILGTIPVLRGHCDVYHPVYWMRDEDDRFAPDENLRRILIPGAVDFKNRDYEGLIAQLHNTPPPTGPQPLFQIYTGGPDREKLETLITARGLNHFFDLAPLLSPSSKVSYQDYLGVLRRCDAILPLLPVERTDYLTNKISTAFAAGIGARRPIIAPQAYADAYGYAGINTDPIAPLDLGKLDLSVQRLANVRNEMIGTWQDALKNNQMTIGRALMNLSINR